MPSEDVLLQLKARYQARFHADRDILSFVAGLARFLALSARRLREGRTWERGRTPRALALPVHPDRDARNVDVHRWRPHGQGVLVAGWHRQGRELGTGRPGDRERPERGCGGRILTPVRTGRRVRPC